MRGRDGLRQPDDRFRPPIGLLGRTAVSFRASASIAEMTFLIAPTVNFRYSKIYLLASHMSWKSRIKQTFQSLPYENERERK